MKPNYFSCIGLIGDFIEGGDYVLSNFIRGLLWLSSLGFIINWLGDSHECNITHNLKQKAVYKS